MSFGGEMFLCVDSDGTAKFFIFGRVVIGGELGFGGCWGVGMGGVGGGTRLSWEVGVDGYFVLVSFVAVSVDCVFGFFSSQ